MHPRHAALAARVGADPGDPPVEEYGPDRVARTALRWGVGGVAVMFLVLGGVAVGLRMADRPRSRPER